MNHLKSFCAGLLLALCASNAPAGYTGFAVTFSDPSITNSNDAAPACEQVCQTIHATGEIALDTMKHPLSRKEPAIWCAPDRPSRIEYITGGLIRFSESKSLRSALDGVDKLSTTLYKANMEYAIAKTNLDADTAALSRYSKISDEAQRTLVFETIKVLSLQQAAMTLTAQKALAEAQLAQTKKAVCLDVFAPKALKADPKYSTFSSNKVSCNCVRTLP